MSTIKQKLLDAIENAPEPVLTEVLHYMEYLMQRLMEDLQQDQDVADYINAKAEAGEPITIGQLIKELSPKE